MSKRGKIGALVAAGLLTFALGSTAFASKPLYGISVTKTANPTTVLIGGTDVTYTIVVTNTGTGSLAVISPVDSLGGCTLSAPSGTGAPTSLAAGDAWTYTCTVTGVTPDTENTVTVHACHNSGGPCNSDTQNANGSASVTVTLGSGATNAPTPSPTAAPSSAASSGASTIPSQPATDTLGTTGSSGPADAAWLLVVALGVILASIVILTPARTKNRR